MRITVVLGAFFPVPTVLGGAVEKFWLAAAEEIARRGHEVTLVSRAFHDFSAHERREGVEYVRVRGFDVPASRWRLKWRDLIYSLRVRRVLPPADILVTNTFWLPLLVCDATRGKLYVHVARAPKGQMKFYRRAARLQAPSSSVADAIKTEAPSLAVRTRVIPYAVPQSAQTPPPISARERILLFVGRVHPEKGVHVLAEAFTREMNNRLKDWQLAVIGPAAIEQGGGGDDYVSHLERVELRGPIFERAALRREMERARIFVYPSLAETGETFGLAVLEAMAAGCAVVVSDLACFRDFISDDETGFIFNHRAADPADALCERLAQIAADESLLNRVANAGRRKSAEYSVENIAKQFLDDFEQVVPA